MKEQSSPHQNEFTEAVKSMIERREHSGQKISKSLSRMLNHLNPSTTLYYLSSTPFGRCPHDPQHEKS